MAEPWIHQKFQKHIKFNAVSIQISENCCKSFLVFNCYIATIEWYPWCASEDHTWFTAFS